VVQKILVGGAAFGAALPLVQGLTRERRASLQLDDEDEQTDGVFCGRRPRAAVGCF
jgi:hypothetical protein